MKVGDKFTIGHESFTVIKDFGGGGQGSVVCVKSDQSGLEYAAKMLNEQNQNVKSNKVTNIQRLIAEHMDEKLSRVSASYGINHALPLKMIPNLGEPAYLMEVGLGKSISKMIKENQISSLSLNEKYTILAKIARSIDMLHNVGFVYTDINWGNFMWDSKTETLTVIDCENVTNTADINSGRCLFLLGTDFFMAPEVGFKKEHVSYFSDRFAYAAFAFRIMTDVCFESPYHGKVMYEAESRPFNMEDLGYIEADGDIEPGWRHFIFDPDYKDNSTETVGLHSKNPATQELRRKLDRGEKVWKGLDPSLKEMFIKAFKDPFNMKDRPTLSMWAKAFENLQNGKNIGILQGNQNTQNPVNQPQNSQPINSAKPVPPSPSNSNKQGGKKPWEKYKSFVPAGGNNQESTPKPSTPPVALPPPPYLLCEDKVVSILEGENLIMGDSLGLSAKALGSLMKDGEDYTFISSVIYNIYLYENETDASPKAVLSSGSSTLLKDGNALQLATSKKKILFRG